MVSYGVRLVSYIVRRTLAVRCTTWQPRNGRPAAERSQAAAEALRDFVVDKAGPKAARRKTAEQGRAQARPPRRPRLPASSRSSPRRPPAAPSTSTGCRRTSRCSSSGPAPSPAGRQPRFTRDQIAAAAIRIADAEGSDALSMRRIAAELDAGTMTLYHYIRTKDELLALVTDAIMGEVVARPGRAAARPTGATAVTVIANRTARRCCERHPWMLDITDDPAIGPNGVRHFDQTLQAVSSLARRRPGGQARHRQPRSTSTSSATASTSATTSTPAATSTTAWSTT